MARLGCSAHNLQTAREQDFSNGDSGEHSYDVCHPLCEFVTPPGKHFCRRCRTVVQVAGETIAAIKLAGQASWEQLSIDTTTHWQIPFTALIVGLMRDGPSAKLDWIIISSCIFMDDESSETCAARMFV